MNSAFKGEYIACSAIYYPNNKEYMGQPQNIKSGIVVCGHRHFNCRIPLVNMFYPNWVEEKKLPMDEQPRLHVLRNEIQGFLTNTNRFVDREEGREIAINADQILESRLPLGKELFSEDIY